MKQSRQSRQASHNCRYPPAAIDWTQGIKCRFGQLRDVIAAAGRSGYRASRMDVIKGGYRVTFQRFAEVARVATPADRPKHVLNGAGVPTN